MYETGTAEFDLPNRTHAVQFYEGEAFLHRAIATYFTQPIREGRHTVMVSRRRTFEAVVEHLRSAPDAALVEGAGRIVFVDVDAALGQFMVDGIVDPVRMEQGFRNVIAQVRHGDDEPMWIYGEMAAVLCKQGNHAAALSLEELWNVHFPEPEYSVMCGYAIEDFDHDAPAFRGVCRQHTHVTPTEHVTDAPDERARFEQIALLQQRARALDAGIRRQPAAVGQAATGHPMVYVVDDDLSVRRSLSRLLTVTGCEVHVCASAEEFLGDPGRSGAGCLLLDVQLVGLSSQELQSRLAGESSATPVVAMSGSHDPQVEIDAMRLGAAAFLRKPFDAQTLMETIARVMGTRRG